MVGCLTWPECTNQSQLWSSDFAIARRNRRESCRESQKRGAQSRKSIWEPPRLPLPQKHPKLRPWSEFPPPRKLRPWSEFLLFPNKYRVWGGLSFGPSFSWTMVWVSSREGRNTGVGVDEWALTITIASDFAIATGNRNLLLSRAYLHLQHKWLHYIFGNNLRRNFWRNCSQIQGPLSTQFLTWCSHILIP